VGTSCRLTPLGAFHHSPPLGNKLLLGRQALVHVEAVGPWEEGSCRTELWADSVLLFIGGGLPPELPSRRGKPPPLLPPLLGPSGGDRETMGLGPPAAQLTPPPAPVGLRGTGLRGLQKDTGPLPTPPGVRPCSEPSTIGPFQSLAPPDPSCLGPSQISPSVTGVAAGGAPQGLPDPTEPLPEPPQPASSQQPGRKGDPGLGQWLKRPPPS
jgi:hypothetical protein